MKDSDIVCGITTRCVDLKTKIDIVSLVRMLNIFHPEMSIYIVDSDSPDKSYFEYCEELDCTILDIANKNYESGTIWHIYNNYEAEKYLFLQDSMVVKNSLEPYFNQDLALISYNPKKKQSVRNWYGASPEVREWVAKAMEQTDYELMKNNFEIVFSCSFLISRKILDAFHSKNLHIPLATDKTGSCGTERILGMALYQEGYKEFTNYLFDPEDVLKVWRNRL